MREVLFQLVAQFVYIYLCVGGEVRAEVVLTAQSTDNYDRLFDVRLRFHQLFDLAQLDAQTAQLDLTVKSAENADVAVLVEFGVVARAVHSLTAILHKRFCGLFGKVAVALSNACAADIQLSCYAVGNKVAVFVNNIFAVVEQRSADGDVRRVGEVCGVAGNGDLGGTIGVDDLDIL